MADIFLVDSQVHLAIHPNTHPSPIIPLSPLSLTSQGSDPRLLLLPSELFVEVFCYLPSLLDVLTFSAVNRRFRDIWTGNVHRVYASVAPGSILCEKHAREFRVDQRGLTFEESSFSVDHALCIAQNAQLVEKTVLQFEKDTVCKVKSTLLSGVSRFEWRKLGGEKKPTGVLTNTIL